MEYIVSAFLMTTEWYAAITLFDAFFARKYRSKKFWTIAFGLQVVIDILIHCFLQKAVVRPLFTVWLIFGMLLVLYGKRAPVLKGLLCFIWMALCIGMDTVALYFSSLITGMSNAEILSTPISFISTFFISKLLLLLIAALVKYLHPFKQVTQKIYWDRLFLLLFFPGVSGAVMLFMMQLGYTNSQYEGFFLVFCLGLTLANVFLFAVLDRLEKDAQLREETILRNQQAELQIGNLAALKNAYSAQKKAAHDYNKHLGVLQALLEEQNVKKAQEYLTELVWQSPTRVLSVCCGHAILDALFNQKCIAAQAADIDVQFSVNDLSGVCIKAEDMVVLIANLLDNALEACARVEHKRAMQVEMTLLQGEIFLAVRNTSLPVKIKENYIPSTKPNPSEHGYGLQNIKTILKLYHAEFAMQYKNGYFQFAAEIPNFRLS